MSDQDKHPKEQKARIDGPSLSEAIRLLAERDRRSLGAHPKIEDLAAYHAGELESHTEARVREHIAVCRECSDLLLDLINFSDLTPPPGEPDLTDEEMEEDWQALRARMGMGEEEPKPKKVAEVVPMVRPAPQPIPPPPRRNWLPVAAAVTAAVLGVLFGLYQRAQVTELNRRLQDLQQIRGVAPKYLEFGTRSGDQVLEISSQADEVVTFNPDAKETYPDPEVEILRGPDVIAKPPLVPGGDTDSVSLQIPKGSLSPGSYQIRLYGKDEGQRTFVDQVTLQVNGP